MNGRNPASVLFTVSGVQLGVYTGQSVTTSGLQGLLVAGSDGTNLRYLKTSNDGTLRIDPTGTTAQPITGSFSDNSSNSSNKIPILAARANTSAPTWTDGNMVPLSVDTSGALRTNAILSSTDLALKGIVDSNNSSSAALNNAATFTGTATDVSAFPSIVISCKTDRSGQLFVDFSPDGTNWDRSLTFDTVANSNEIHRLTVIYKYARIRFTNNSGANQTFFRLQTLLGAQTPLSSPLNQTPTNNADSIVTRSVLMGQNDNGAWGFVPITTEGHLEVAVHDPKGPFGSIHTESWEPIFQSDAVYGLSAATETPTTSGSGSVTATDSAFVCSTGTTIYSQAVLQSKDRLRYRAGQGSILRFTALYTSPVVNSYQVAGLGHAEDGFYFGYKDTSFGILHVNRGVRATYTLTVTTGATSSGNVTITLNGVANVVAVTNASNIQRTVWEISQGTYTGWKAHPLGATVIFVKDAVGTTPNTFSFAAGTTGAAASIAQTKAGAASTDTFIAQSSWNGDTLDGSLSSSNPSGFLLDPTKGNVYQIKMQYLGFGVVSFQVEVTAAGNNSEWVTVHQINFPNTLTATSVGNPTMPFTVAAYSAGSTTNLTVKVGSFAGFVEGKKKLTGPRIAYVDIATATPSAYTPAFTIFNPRYYNGRANQAVINIQGIGIGSKHGDALTLYLIKNGALTGNPNFISYSSSSMALWDNVSTAVTISNNNQILEVLPIGASGSGYLQTQDNEDVALLPGEWISVCVKTAAANASNLQIAMNTREDQ